MPTLMMRFPGGRYHATPQGHHVNEGLIEWPPSPWRLLRALLATGYATLHWESGLDNPLLSRPPELACSLLLKLAGALPCYRLPSASGAHSRHYMPLIVLDKGREKTTLVFDTWADVRSGDLAITWEIALTPAEQGLLGQLAERLGYLGRSESWVMARVARAGESLPEGSDCFPAEASVAPGPGWEQVAVVAAEAPEHYAAWREAAVTEALAAYPLPDKRPPKKLLEQRAKAEAPFPADLIACLQADTHWLRGHGWSQPPGSRKALYWRRADALEAGAPVRRRSVFKPAPVRAMLLALATESGNDHALPPVTRTLPQAELLHRALVSQTTRGGGHSAVLSGCDLSGLPLKGPHVHAHILPLDLDGDGHLEHILIWAPMGLDADAQAAVRALRRTYAKGGMGPIKVALAAAGDWDDLMRLPGQWSQGLAALVQPPPGANEWVSSTPFVAPRYLKPRGAHSLFAQVASELTSRELPALLDLAVVDPRDSDGRYLRQRHFIRRRGQGPQPPVDFGYTLWLRLAAPCRGPLSLGYGSHFGLGSFVADANLAEGQRLRMAD